MIRVLQLIGQLGRGGDTTVVLDVMNKTDQSKIQFDFMTHDRADLEVVEELRAQGHTVYVLPGDVRKAGPVKYYRMVKKILKESPVKYDIFHAHTSMQSGVALMAAKHAGIKKRICHSHTSAIQNKTSKINKMILTPVFRFLYKTNANVFVGCSKMAGDFLFGKDSSYRLIYNGVDTASFRNVTEDATRAVREELGIKDTDIVIGHVAHFGNLKNQIFDLELMSSLKDREDIRLVLVGKGANFEKIQAKAKEMGLEGKVIFTGQRSDVPILMRCFDCVILPSLPGEGFPVTMMEAQAAGCQCIISEHVTPEVEVGLNLVQIISLTKPQDWEKAIRDMKQNNDTEKRNERSAQLEKRGFGRKEFVCNWLKLYIKE